jgi:hypothetical protein
VRYATCLVAFALRALDGHDAALATQGVSMFDNRILEERILQLTQAPERPDPSTRLARLAGASAGLVLAMTMALLFHITPTWAETPVQLAPPQVDLPAIPAAPEAPPAPPAAPPAPPAPVAPSQHVHQHLDQDTRRAMAEEDRQRARDEAQRQREEAGRQRELAQQQREEVVRQREEAQRQREEGQRQRELAQQQHERALEQAQAERERVWEQTQAQREHALEQAQAERERAQEQRDAANEVTEARQASRNYAAAVKRQVAEAIKAGDAMQGIDMDKIKREIAQATANVHTPEFKAQMADLQAHMQQLHDNMAELSEHMKRLNHEVEKSADAPL